MIYLYIIFFLNKYFLLRRMIITSEISILRPHLRKKEKVITITLVFAVTDVNGVSSENGLPWVSAVRWMLVSTISLGFLGYFSLVIWMAYLELFQLPGNCDAPRL